MKVEIDADLFDRIKHYLESMPPDPEAAAILQALEDAEIERTVRALRERLYDFGTVARMGRRSARIKSRTISNPISSPYPDMTTTSEETVRFTVDLPLSLHCSSQS